MDNWKKEWANLKVEESQFLMSHDKKKDNPFYSAMDKVIPEKLQNTIEVAFDKAFEVVFEMGTPVIEKTYDKKKAKGKFYRNSYALQKKESKENLNKFKADARKTKNLNMTVAAVEGAGFGMFGVVVPDIPIFTGVLLRSVYEIAMQYGFSYKTEKEQIFILKVMETALLKGEEQHLANSKINQFIDDGTEFGITKEEQMKQTAQSLSNALLYMKCIQNIPIVGVVGGATDVLVLHQITKYADLKYHRRFIQKTYFQKKEDKE